MIPACDAPIILHHVIYMYAVESAVGATMTGGGDPESTRGARGKITTETDLGIHRENPMAKGKEKGEAVEGETGRVGDVSSPPSVCSLRSPTLPPSTDPGRPEDQDFSSLPFPNIPVGGGKAEPFYRPLGIHPG